MLKPSGQHRGTQLPMQKLAAPNEPGIVVLTDDNPPVPRQLVCHDHGRPPRRLAGHLVEQVVRGLVVMHDDERHAQHRHRADAAIQSLVLKPVLVFRCARGRKVEYVAEQREWFWARWEGEFRMGFAGGYESVGEVAGDSEDAP